MRHKIGAYIRVSTEEQAAAVEGSLDNQRYRLKAFLDLKLAQEKNWGEIIEFYLDDGYSAKDTRRPAYQRMMIDIKRKKVDLILVTDLSRLSRNIFDFCKLMGDLEKVGAQFLSMKEQFDTSTPAGKMMIYNMINLAQFEREQVSERVSLGVHARAMRGLLNGARPILGYDKHPDKPGTYIVNEEEAEDVRKIFRHFLNTGSRAKTIQELEKEGIKPKQSGKYARLRIGDKWNSPSLGNLLASAAYIGCREVNKSFKSHEQDRLRPYQQYKVVKATWPAIVSEADFSKAQLLLEEAQKLERVRLEGTEDRFYILSGLLRCHECGHPLVGQAAHGQNSIHRYYGHTRAGAKFDCKIKRVPAQDAETAVLEYLWDATRDAGYMNHIEQNIKSMRSVRSLNVAREKRDMRERINGIQVRLDNLLLMQSHASSGETVQHMVKTFEALTKEKADSEKEFHRLEEKPERSQFIAESLQLIDERLREFERGFKKAGGAMKKRLLRRLLKQVLVTPEGLKMYMLLAGQEDIPNYQIKLVKESNSENPETPVFALIKRASGDDSKLQVLSSDNGKVGDATWIRTRDLLLRRRVVRRDHVVIRY